MRGMGITELRGLEESINSVSKNKYKIIRENGKLQLVMVVNEKDGSILPITPFLNNREMEEFINSLLTYLRVESRNEKNNTVLTA